MLAQRFLHPRHIVPRAEFIGAMGEPPHRSKAQMGVEGHTVAGQIGVVVIGIGDAGVEILHILGLGDTLQLGIQPLAQTLATNVLPQIDAGLHPTSCRRPVPQRGRYRRTPEFRRFPRPRYRGSAAGCGRCGHGTPPARALHIQR